MSADGGCRCISRNLEFIQAFPGVIRRTGAEVSTMELREFVANLHGNRRNGFRIVLGLAHEVGSWRAGFDGTSRRSRLAGGSAERVG